MYFNWENVHKVIDDKLGSSYAYLGNIHCMTTFSRLDSFKHFRHQQFMKMKTEVTIAGSSFNYSFIFQMKICLCHNGCRSAVVDCALTYYHSSLWFIVHLSVVFTKLHSSVINPPSQNT